MCLDKKRLETMVMMFDNIYAIKLSKLM